MKPAADDAMKMGRVAFGPITKDVCLAYVPDVGQGEYVVVHAGFAISRIDEAEAKQVWAYLENTGETDELTEAGTGDS